jgi:hypothetical protein
MPRTRRHANESEKEEVRRCSAHGSISRELGFPFSLIASRCDARRRLSGVPAIGDIVRTAFEGETGQGNNGLVIPRRKDDWPGVSDSVRIHVGDTSELLSWTTGWQALGYRYLGPSTHYWLYKSGWKRALPLLRLRGCR